MQTGPKAGGNTRSGGGCVSIVAVVLTALFVALKLTHTIAWSWWWVFAPVELPLALWLLAGVATLVAASTIGRNGGFSRHFGRSSIETAAGATQVSVRTVSPDRRYPNAPPRMTVEVRFTQEIERLGANSCDQLTDEVIRRVDGQFPQVRELLQYRLREAGWT